MSAKHTPGPWYTKREGYSTVYIESKIGNGWIQEVAACGPTEKGFHQQQANARLIASAPDLLYALERIANGQEMVGEFTHADVVLRYQEIARAAIAKATGEQ